MTRAPLFLGTAALLALAAVLCYEHPSPGPLTSAHATAGASLPTCESCHAEAGLDAGCLGCHAGIAAQLAGQRGYHHEVAGAGAPRCARCHPEHHGASFDIMEAVAWRPGSRDGFRHDAMSFQLVEAHAELDCEACHKTSFAMPGYAHRPRRKTFLGLSQSCAACHGNVHASEELSDCMRCHGQTAFKPARGFDHDEHMPLIGAHAAVACKDCHTSNETLSFETVRGTTCAGCHENPHRTTWNADCQACHLPEAPSWNSGAEHVTAAVHLETGFPLARPHGELSCETCHAAGEPYAGRYASPPRVAERCDACHTDVHAGQFAGRYGACTQCHAQTHFSPAIFGADRHAGFALRDAHRGAACSACHKEIDGVCRYVGTPTRCADCHDDVHAGQFEQSCAACHDERAFAPPNHGVAAHASFPLRGAHLSLGCAACHKTVDGVRRYVDTPNTCAGCHDDIHAGQFEQSCESCHDETAFRPARYGIRRHTVFALRGAHDAVACIACHTKDETGVRRFVDTPSACATCHEDPHGRQFASGTASRDCTACHTAGSSTFSIPSFDHARQTGYALEGKHAGARCNDCHRPAKAGAPRRYRGTPTRCDTCHADRHRGQFPGRDCSSCHGSQSTWTAANFDHGRTRFALDARHARVACAGCHTPVKQRDGLRIVQYRPLGHRCEDCHDVRR